MYIRNASPTVKNCLFENNHAKNAGGSVYNKSTSIVLDDCIFANNTAQIGGAIYNGSSVTANIHCCDFMSNTATNNGGAIFNISSNLQNILNCFFQSNSATINGGAIFNIATSPPITNCAFLENSATEGSAILNQASANPSITNCSFHNNMANPTGGAIRNLTGTSPTITNCILWGNGTEIVEALPMATVTYSIVQQATGTYPGTGNLNTDPYFTGPDDLRILSCSPATNVGNNAANTTTLDLDKNTRLMMTTIDLGAYEVQSSGSATNTWTGNGDDLLWDDPSNWDQGDIPNICQDVVIPSGNNVEVPSGVTGQGKTLEVEAGATLKTQTTGELDIRNQ